MIRETVPSPAESAAGRPAAPVTGSVSAELSDRIRAGERITDADALALLDSRDLLALGALAEERRQRAVPGDLVTFIIDRNINYTNLCLTQCDFCAFYRPVGDGEGYLLSKDEIYAKIQETLDLGGTAVMMQGGLHPELDIAYYEDLFSSIKTRFDITIHSLSPPEVLHIARVSDLPVGETLGRLHTAGLDSLPGGGAEILVDRVRRHVAPRKASTGEWLGVMREAHRSGMPTTATMMFGSVETPAERVEHLRRIRDLQDETLGQRPDAAAAPAPPAATRAPDRPTPAPVGFRAFIPWTFQEGNTALEGFTEPATAVDYLTTLAVSRIYLDNVPHIQASWVTQGLKIGQVALRFGADDLGSTMIEENVVAAAGVSYRVNAEELVRAVEAAGFRAAQRRTDYSLVRVFG
jgi:cyclic dehypoxanthinyl futalosine synthase